MPQFRAQVKAYFLAHPGEWISADALYRIGGHQAWRTRVSEVRRLDGLTIENQVRFVLVDSCGEDQTRRGYRVSEYRYVPPIAAVMSPPGEARCLFRS